MGEILQNSKTTLIQKRETSQQHHVGPDCDFGKHGSISTAKLARWSSASTVTFRISAVLNNNSRIKMEITFRPCRVVVDRILCSEEKEPPGTCCPPEVAPLPLWASCCVTNLPHNRLSKPRRPVLPAHSPYTDVNFSVVTTSLDPVNGLQTEKNHAYKPLSWHLIVHFQSVIILHTNKVWVNVGEAVTEWANMGKY